MARLNRLEAGEQHRLHSEGLRRCSRCGETLPLEAFGSNVRDKYGLQRWCRPCVNEYNRGFVPTPEQRARDNALNRARRRENPIPREVHRRNNLWRNYGITPEDYATLLSAQSGRCAICGSDKAYAKTEHFHVDHHHETGAIRGLLCGRCNPALGAFQDDPAILAAAIRYLEETK